MNLNKKPIALIIGSILMILLGLARGIGGLVLLLQGSETLPGIQSNETVLIFLAAILILIGITEIIAAIGVFLLRKGYIFLGIVTTIIFVIDGAVNGYFLFGKPGGQGTIVNIIAAAIIISFLLAGKKSLSNKLQFVSTKT